MNLTSLMINSINKNSESPRSLYFLSTNWFGLLISFQISKIKCVIKFQFVWLVVKNV